MKQKLTDSELETAAGGDHTEWVGVDAATAAKLDQGVCPLCGRTYNNTFVAGMPVAQCRACWKSWRKWSEVWQYGKQVKSGC